jgi:hypothetical protein
MRSFCVAISAIAFLSSFAPLSTPTYRSIWSEGPKLVASDAQYLDSLGISASVSGDALLLGAHLDDDGGIDTGAAYVFVDTGSSWGEVAKLKASDSSPYDYFGHAAALDGDTAVIGAYHKSGAGTFSGAAYVFVRTGTTWSEEAKLLPADPAAHDWFGWSVAIEGDTALVSAPYDDDGFTPDVGSVYVFVRDGTTWTEEVKLRASDAAAGDYFGYALSLEPDMALIGAHGDDDAGNDSGSAYVFSRTGTSWAQDVRLAAADAAAGNQFGWSVSLSDDTALIGAPTDDPASLIDSGSAYIFTTTGTSWTEEAKILPGDGEDDERFGSAVALDDDTAIISAPGTGLVTSDPGAAYFFERVRTRWSEAGKVSGSDTELGDAFGQVVSIDGRTALIGAPEDDHGGVNLAGSAYVFDAGPAASAAFRNAGTNPASYSVLTLPILGTDYETTVDLSMTGHPVAVLVGYAAPITMTLPGGRTALVDFSGPELLGFPIATGSLASIDISIPDEVTFAGYVVFTQAVHTGGGSPYILSNAQDLVLGY